MAKKAAKSKRKTVSKKVSKPVMKTPNIKDPLSKSGMINAIVDMTDIARRDVAATLEAFRTLIEHHLKSRGPGKFVMPGVLKITVVKKPARPARKGINPFTGEEMMFKAKPAMRVVKIKALKKLKEVVV